MKMDKFAHFHLHKVGIKHPINQNLHLFIVKLYKKEQFVFISPLCYWQGEAQGHF